MVTTSNSRLPREGERSGLGPVGLRFRSILVATECSPASGTALRLAARLAKLFHAKLHVLHATMPELYGVGLAGPVPELAILDLETARENLHKYALRIPELRTVVHKEIVFLGSAAGGIESVGKSHDIDLLVLSRLLSSRDGNHSLARALHRAAFRRAFLQDTTEYSSNAITLLISFTF